jgi:hypothetical protein
MASPQYKKYEVVVHWGPDGHRDSQVRTYRFNTGREAEAFKSGVRECTGWLNADIAHWGKTDQVRAYLEDRLAELAGWGDADDFFSGSVKHQMDDLTFGEFKGMTLAPKRTVGDILDGHLKSFPKNTKVVTLLYAYPTRLEVMSFAVKCSAKEARRLVKAFQEGGRDIRYVSSISAWCAFDIAS